VYIYDRARSAVSYWDLPPEAAVASLSNESTPRERMLRRLLLRGVSCFRSSAKEHCATIGLDFGTTHEVSSPPPASLRTSTPDDRNSCAWHLP